ncbi:hypothetical protein PYCCODRAFT_1254137 [Trametes coccinea BRFM310]|uniref:Uncharacterized protein n=1 Tax=Trametes coccinea (strain BRFM310) TaxID=1353009 RepID=A0A1Y2I8N3_TRAC3|nr:hypothetical protein PYCCODRAFT_1254137 [Trametes coccinea BRFM310]
MPYFRLRFRSLCLFPAQPGLVHISRLTTCISYILVSSLVPIPLSFRLPPPFRSRCAFLPSRLFPLTRRRSNPFFGCIGTDERPSHPLSAFILGARVRTSIPIFDMADIARSGAFLASTIHDVLAPDAL